MKLWKRMALNGVLVLALVGGCTEYYVHLLSPTSAEGRAYHRGRLVGELKVMLHIAPENEEWIEGGAEG